MIKKHFLVCISLLLLAIPFQSKKVYGNFFESTNVNINSDEISIVVALDEELNNKEFVTFTNDLETNQELIMKIRNQNRNNFKEKNSEFSKKYIKTNGKLNISEHSPFIFITFDDYESYLHEKEYFKVLSENNFVDSIYVEETPKFEVASSSGEVSVNTSDSLELVDMDEAKEIINVNYNSIYTGDGVNVGIIDEGYPNNTLNFTNNEIVDYNTLWSSEHTNKVASIIGGTHGIATNSNLYIHSYSPSNSDYNFDDGIEWLLGKGVNVVNISMYSDGRTGNQGEYDGHSAYLDYIVWNNYLTIVKSAGNRGRTDDFVTNPGVGMNTISVGSIDGNKNISDYSSWDVDSSIDGILMKPTLVAPGENIIIPNTNNSILNSTGTALENDYSGTSFAAPMVTGVIALLMEEFPRLMEYPEAYMSALISGASKLPSQSSVWDTYAGAGLINYEATREILKSSSYVNTSITNSTSSSTAVISKDVSVEANKEVDYCLFLIQNSNVTSPSSTVYTPNLSKYQVKIYDENNVLVETNEYGENSNVIIGTINNSSTNSKIYSIKVYLIDKKTSTTEYLSLSIYNHVHSCCEWIYYNRISHKSVCHCGLVGATTEAHMISQADIFKPTARCLGCNALLDMGGNGDIGMVPGILSTSVNIITENGSYILPNGIIVLVEEDIEAYLNGTLIFYDEDETLVTQ